MASRLPLLNPRVWKIDRCARYVPLLESVLAGRPSLNGDRLSLATGRMCLALLPDTIVSTPGYREHVMIPFDDLKGKLSF